MTLGEIMRMFDDEQVVARLLPDLGDEKWQARAASFAEGRGEELAAYAGAAVGRFAGCAGDEDWMSLLGSLNRACDPGAHCLRRMVDWAMARDGGARTR